MNTTQTDRHAEQFAEQGYVVIEGAVSRALVDDLRAALDRKEEELVAAHDTLARLSERVLGRMLLKRIRR